MRRCGPSPTTRNEQKPNKNESNNIRVDTQHNDNYITQMSYYIKHSSIEYTQYTITYDTRKYYMIANGNDEYYEWITYYNKNKGLETSFIKYIRPTRNETRTLWNVKNVRLNCIVELDEYNIGKSIERINKLALLI